MNNSNRTILFLVYFLGGFGGCIITGLILIWLFPVDALFNMIAIPSLFGFSLIVGLVVAILSISSE